MLCRTPPLKWEHSHNAFGKFDRGHWKQNGKSPGDDVNCTMKDIDRMWQILKLKVSQRAGQPFYDPEEDEVAPLYIQGQGRGTLGEEIRHSGPLGF